MKIYMLREDQIEALCKDISERVAKNASVAPQLCYAPVRFAIEDLISTVPEGKIAAVVPEREVVEALSRLHNVFVPTGLAKPHFPGQPISTELKILPLQGLVKDIVKRTLDEITKASA